MEELFNYLGQKTGKTLEATDILEMNPTHLAYIGDAIYEVFVRLFLLLEYKESMNRLHNRAVDYVRAGAQSDALTNITAILSEEEMRIVKRGRNTKSSNIPSGADMIDYRRSTAFETLLGYLFLNGRYERLFEIMGHALGLQKNTD